jgi:hypothetical protein
MLQGRETFALASDEGAQSFLLVSLPNDVQAVRLASLDLDADIETELGHELLEDLFRSRHGLWRYFSRLGTLGVRSDASSSNLRQLIGRQAGLGATLRAVITRPPIGASATAAVTVDAVATGARATVARGATVATGARATVARGARATIDAVATGARATVARGATVATGARATVARGARATIAVLAVVPLTAREVITVVAIWGWGGQRDLCRSLTLGGNATKKRLRRGENARRLSTHPKDTSGAWGQDLEVEIVVANSKLLAGVAKGLFDRFAGELAVSVAIGSHFSVVSLVGLSAGGC